MTAAIDPRTRLGAVRLNVRDLDGMARFYELRTKPGSSSPTRPGTA